jgi:hypothetical protein
MQKQNIIAFLSNKLTLRGTEVALYDYAYYNEKILGNKSIIITRDYEKVKNEFDVDILAYLKFKDKFEMFYYENTNDIDNIIINNNITHLYVIKSGNNDGLLSSNAKNLIHCIFSSDTPHGDIYCVLGKTINDIYNTNYPILPHIVQLPDVNDNFRSDLNIPQDAIVFGRYGGKESFDINFAKDEIKNILNQNNNIYFLFMNTYRFHEHKNIIYLPSTSDLAYKRKFINTCDALIHARNRGETFGLTCGEFAICKKPVITYGNSREKEHINILKDKAIIYNNQEELHEIISNFKKDKYDMNNNGYMEFTPEKIMNIFKNVFQL